MQYDEVLFPSKMSASFACRFLRVWVLIGLIVLNIDVFLDDGSGRGFLFNVEHVDEVCVAGV